eukprot:TRINITY_DN2754_c0_g1_i2.p1 TRINITY_DN2754_c0_g1~~TRINITY_DN2754_c0_g1_i2.p1  ORF type:complete len:265 (-),score=49.52 TRINITY_DN2754_c0_g1_i2:200-994(-)
MNKSPGYFYFNMQNCGCTANNDGFWNSRSEYYFTWSLYETGAGNPDDPLFSRCGYSTAVPIDKGWAMKKGDNILTNDPHFDIPLPEIQGNGTKEFVLSVQCWEHDDDDSTVAIKKMFVDGHQSKVAARMMEMQERQDQAADDARQAFVHWLTHDFLDEASRVAIATGPTGAAVAGGIAITRRFLPGLELAVNAAQTLSKDDFIGESVVRLKMKKTGVAYTHEWNFGSGFGKPGKTGETFIENMHFIEHDGGNKVSCACIFQLHQ